MKVQYRNAGGGDVSHSKLVVVDGHAAYYGVDGNDINGPSTAISFQTRPVKDTCTTPTLDTVLNVDQVTDLRDRLTTWLKDNKAKATKPRVKMIDAS